MLKLSFTTYSFVLISKVILLQIVQENKFMVLVLESVVNWVSPGIRLNQFVFPKLYMGLKTLK